MPSPFCFALRVATHAYRYRSAIVAGSLATLACSSSGDDSPPVTGGTGGTTVTSGGSSSETIAGASPTGGRNASAGSAGSFTGSGGAPAGGNNGSAGLPNDTGGRSSGGAAGTASAGVSGSGTSGSGSGGRSAGNGGTASGGSGGSASGCNATGFYVKDGAIYDVKCNEFVLRGINYPYTWFSTRNTQQDLTAIAATGANAVRIVMSTGGRWTKTTAANLTSLIQWAKAAKLVAIVEVHDSTGYSEQSGSVALADATSYWTASDISTALEGQEAFVMINLANEPNGNDTSSSWAPTHVAAVQALRNAGYNHTLMVDAPNWGQDWENTMRNGGGKSIWDADTKKNMVFSVHMYDVYGVSATVSSYFNTFSMNYEAPLVVGEFAADHASNGDVDENAIMSFAETLGIGYLGWSWSGNGGDLASLDITKDFDASSLSTWGNRLINGENGIKSTSKPCACFE